MTEVSLSTVAVDAPEADRRVPTLSAWLSLAFLVAVGLYIYGDRHVVTLQAQTIKVALRLSDLQLGLVQGVGVAIFAAAVGYPVAWLADRYSRRLILALCLLLWGCAVAASGFVTSFWQLFLTSAVVGAGEAALLPITYAVIPELFAGRSRAIANAMTTVIGRLSSGVVIAAAGFAVQAVAQARPGLPPGLSQFAAWRLTFMVIALPAPLFALLALVIDLGRSRTRTTGARAAPPPSVPLGAFLRANAVTLAPFSLGVGFLVFGMSAFGAFLPVVAMRQMGAGAAQVGAGFGAATTVSTLLAMGGIVLANAALPRILGPAYPIKLLALASLVPAILAPLFLWASTPNAMFVVLGLCFLPLAFGSMAFPTALQDLTPPAARARLVAVAIVVNIILSGAAPLTVGALSDHLGAKGSALLEAVVITATAGLGLSALLLVFASRGYVRTAKAAQALGALDAGPAA